MLFAIVYKVNTCPRITAASQKSVTRIVAGQRSEERQTTARTGRDPSASWWPFAAEKLKQGRSWGALPGWEFPSGPAFCGGM